MRFAFELLKTGHDLVDFGHLARVGVDEKFGWDFNVRTPAATWAAVAHRRGELAGIVKWREAINADGEVWCESIASFVWPRFRRHGVGLDLWQILLDETRTSEVCVGVVSDRGLTLVESLRERYPSVRFRVTESGERKLRCLKGAGANAK